MRILTTRCWAAWWTRMVGSGCLMFMLGQGAPVEAKLRIVATTADFGVLAEAIGGKQVDVTVLAKPTEDPHFVDAKPSFMVKLNRADLLIEGGADLEAGWLPPLVLGARNAKLAKGQPGRLAASEGLTLLGVPMELDRSQGDIHALGNPHFMVDPVRAGVVAERIADACCRLDPASCASYRVNLAEFRRKLDAKLAEWERVMNPFKGASLVAYHDSWVYFADRYGLQLELFLEPKPGIPPTPGHLAEVSQRMKEANAKVILVEPYVNRKTAERVAEATGAVVVDAPHFPGGIKEASGDYIALMDYLVKTVALTLGEAK